MQPSGSTARYGGPDVPRVHTTAPGNRDAAPCTRTSGYAARVRCSCGLTPYTRLKALDRANALP